MIHVQWEDGHAVDNKGNVVYMSIDCPVCNNIIKTADRETSKKNFPRCPFCGAIMDGGLSNGKC